MARGTTIRWTGDVQVKNNMALYAEKVKFAVKQISLWLAGELESTAKRDHKWVDRTGNATQSLRAWSEDIAEGVVRTWLAHGVHYGIFLEVKYSGKYSVIWPTIQSYLPTVERMLKEIFA